MKLKSKTNHMKGGLDYLNPVNPQNTLLLEEASEMTKILEEFLFTKSFSLWTK